MNRFALGSTDWQKIFKGLLIAVIGAVLTYFTPIVTHWDFGVYTPVVYVVWSTLTNTAWKVLDGQVNK